MALSNNSLSSDACSWNREDIAIEVRDVSKSFYIYEHRVSSLRERFVKAFKNRGVEEKKAHFSLQKVALTIGAGETWALIGPNGAGKSTLLRLMAGIYWPTTGEVVTHGRMAALIELSAGFHPELTGAENVFLYGAILGYSRKELSRRYREIVDFAGIEEFMATPLKYYSTGMQMRLGFSVATAVEPNVLLLDEILAIGDADFQTECLRKLRKFQNSGCTLVIATHDLEAARNFATHALWLDHGRVRLQGNGEDVIAAYKVALQD